MAGVIVDLVGGADLYDVAGVHHGHPVGNVGHDAQVVGDHDDGQVVFGPQLLEQLQNLSLNGHIQRGGGLVTDQDLRAAGHRNGDHHALTHAAGELVGVLLKTHFRVRDAHVPQVFQCSGSGLGALQALVQGHGLQNLVADGFQRVQAGHGVLHDHGNFAAPDAQPVLFGFQAGQAHRLCAGGRAVVDGAAGDGAIGVQQAHETLGEHALAGAGLAHDGQHFAPVQVQVDAADGVQHPAAQVEPDIQPPHREDAVIFVHHAFLLTAGGSSGRRRPRTRCRSDRTQW